jgi:endoglycosylceramidase
MQRRTRRVTAAVVAVVATASLGAACAAAPIPAEFPDGAGDVVPVAAADTTGPIEFRGPDLIDDRGRVVQIHGINMVRKAAPFHVSPDEPNFEENLDRIVRAGFNGVRLGVWMAALMPQPGVIDAAYLDEVQRGLDALAERDMWVLLDFHQDVFTGMPAWATTPEAAALSPTLPGSENAFWALGYLSPRSMRQWEDFYTRVPVADGRSAVDLMGDAIAAVAERFEDTPNVIGIDLINEPWPGERFFDCLVGGCGSRYTQLRSIYEEYTTKIRAVAPGMHVWWAPYNFGPPFQQSPPPSQPDIGFTFHSYCLYTDGGEPVQPGPLENTVCGSVYDSQVLDGAHVGAYWDAPVLLGEFGASASPLNTTRLTELADQRRMSWLYWDDNYFRQAPEVVRADLIRVYPQATAGQPLAQRFDPATGAFEFRYRPDPSVTAPTSIAVPTDPYPDGYTVTAAGANVTSAPNAGRLTLVADPGATEVTVQLRREAPAP